MTTKDRILDAAEILFAERGIAATSLRALTSLADTNLASVNYHFQSKDALVQAVLYRLFQPVNRRRHELLQQAQQANPGQPLPVETILDCFYRPVVEMAFAQPDDRVKHIACLIGRLYIEPGDVLIAQIRSLMAETAAKFLEALARSLPHLTQHTLLWRLHFMVGVMAHTFGAIGLIEGLSRGQVALRDPEETISHMVAFAAGGLRAEKPQSQGVRP
jgi:AcrR family transcriptional regulator